MRLLFLFSFISISSIALYGQVKPLQNAHAHNDYEHPRPLFDALAQGFTSVEADVHLIDGALYVYHDRPSNPSPERSLKRLYLEPLAQIVRANAGRVYPDYQTVFFLMIDIKSDGEQVYRRLRQLLEPYQDILTQYQDDLIQQGAVTIFLSGDRPFAAVQRDTARLVGLDGRVKDIGQGYSPSLMPVISDNFSRLFEWDGSGQISETEWKKLRLLVANAHAEGKRVRFWATPDHPNAWRTLLRAQVDLINTDDLPGLRRFLNRSN